jgi:formylmethanofuran dehydrogenase subunit E
MLAPLLLTSLLALTEAPTQGPTSSDCLVRVREIHGAAGPWAVAGYRIGERSLKELKLPRHSVSILVIHRCPAQVQYSCMADGLQAATGASPGKLNLRVEEGPMDRLSTIVEDRKTGRRLTFTLRPEFVRSIRDVPRERLEEEGRRVATLANDDIFYIIIADPKTSEPENGQGSQRK